MKIIIHPEANINIDNKANDLITLIKEVSSQKVEGVHIEENFDPDLYIGTTIDSEDIKGEMNIGWANHLGEEVGKSFLHENKEYALKNESYLELLKVAQNIQKNNSLKDTVSVEFIKEELFLWIKKTIRGQCHEKFTDHLNKVAESSVKHYEVWIPVPYTIIQSSFRLGKINFKTISTKQLEEWFAYHDKESKKPDERTIIDAYHLKIRKEYQGYAAGVYECEAEPIRAQELAYYHISNSLGILRLLSLSNVLPDAINYAYEYGQKMVRSKAYFILNKEERQFNDVNELLDKSLIWKIHDDIISMVNNHAFKNYHDLLELDYPNEFQAKLLDALLIYSRHTLMRNMYDKLLYILVGLESILLKNDSEPIQQSVADRMAFAIGKQPDERRKIVRILKDVYAVRSKYIHHGVQGFENQELFKEFMSYAFTTFDALVRNLNKFKTKEEFIDAIEHIKYSGP